MIFIALLILVTLAIAGCAAYFSVYGLAHIFTSVFWSVVVMGGSLEAGKLMTASFLYRFWDKMNKWLRAYLMIAMLGLMALTSVGIYGYLTAGYQTDSIPLKQMEQQIALWTDEKTEIQKRLDQINADIDRVASNYITKRIELKNSYKQEQDEKIARLAEINKSLSELTTKKLNQEAHTGPIVYIAKQLGKEVDDATSLMVLLIIFIFDPLAVALTLACNQALESVKKDKPKKNDDDDDPDPSPQPDDKDRNVDLEEEGEDVSVEELPEEIPIEEAPVEELKVEESPEIEEPKVEEPEVSPLGEDFVKVEHDHSDGQFAPAVGYVHKSVIEAEEQQEDVVEDEHPKVVISPAFTVREQIDYANQDKARIHQKKLHDTHYKDNE